MQTKFDVQVFYGRRDAILLISRRNNYRQQPQRFALNRLSLIFFHEPLTSNQSGCCSAWEAISSNIADKSMLQCQPKSRAACVESITIQGTSYFRGRSSFSGW